MKININEALFDEVKNKLLDLPTDPLFEKNSENFKNEKIQYFGMCFCQKRLIDAYNCTFEEFKTPQFIISDCFFAGILARKLYNINDTDDAIVEIQNILTEQTLSVFDILKGWFVGEVEVFENLSVISEKSIIKMKNYLKYIDVSSCSLCNVLTVMYAVFLFGASMTLNSNSEII